jgi:hypothetical protein
VKRFSENLIDLPPWKGFAVSLDRAFVSVKHFIRQLIGLVFLYDAS